MESIAKDNVNKVLCGVETKYNPPNLEEVETSVSDKEHIYVFASYDLCNSTLLKKKSKYWIDVINVFTRKVDIIPLMQIWKFNGDELLFYTEITELVELPRILHEVYEGIETIKNALLSTIETEENKANGDLFSFERKNIDIRGTVWIAKVQNLELRNNTADNYQINISGEDDFSGINIDEGFRLCTHATRHRLVVDPKIAYLLYLYKIFADKDDDGYLTDFFSEFKQKVDQSQVTIRSEIVTCTQNFRIVDYKISKGIWEGRLYPIIWYSEDWKDNFEQTVQYDEKISGNYLLNVIDQIKDPESSMYGIQRILTIMKQVGEENTIKSILNNIGVKEKDGVSHTRKLNNNAKLYYMVACINKQHNKVLIFQRSTYRKHLRGVWDLGNVKHTGTQYSDVKQSIEEKYKKIFGIDIDIVMDDKRKDRYGSGTIKPFALCTVPRFGKLHNGILCFATIKDDLNDEEILAIINKKLTDEKTTHPHSYDYNQAMFVDKDFLEQQEYTELTFEDVVNDSQNADLDKAADFSDEKKYINNLLVSITEAIEYFNQ